MLFKSVGQKGLSMSMCRAGFYTAMLRPLIGPMCIRGVCVCVVVVCVHVDVIISWQKIHIDYRSNSYRDIVSRRPTGMANGSEEGGWVGGRMR